MKASIRYQIAETRKPLIIYYVIIFTLLALSYIASDAIFGLSFNGTVINGIEIASVIFIFVAGLNSFRESFGMLIQNSRSRKTVFLSFIWTLLSVCALMALIDSGLGAAGRALQTYNSLFLQFYGARFNGAWAGVQAFCVGFLWSFSLYTVWGMAGYLITTLYYRLNKPLKLLVSIGTPVILIIVLPMLDAVVTQGAIYRGIGEFFKFVSGANSNFHPLYPMLSSMAISVLLAMGSYLLVRRAVVKNQV